MVAIRISIGPCRTYQDRALSKREIMPTITCIETMPVLYPTVGQFKFFEQPPGRKAGRPCVVVKVTADDGSVGWGECVPSPRWSYETLETVQSTIERYLAPE